MRANLLLETPAIYTGHASEAEIEAEWAAMQERSRVTQLLIDGKIDWEYFFDWMIQHGIEPAELIDTAQENLNWAIQQGIFIEL